MFSSSYILTIAFLGHFSAQVPQWVHFVWSMTARGPSMVMASDGQLRMHRLHPIHPIPQAFMTTGPLSLDMQDTIYWAS